MFDENLIATLEQSLRQTRNAQIRLMARLREVQTESELLREEIQALENSATQTESAIDSLLVTMRSGSRSLKFGRRLRLEEDLERPKVSERQPFKAKGTNAARYAFDRRFRRLYQSESLGAVEDKQH